MSNSSSTKIKKAATNFDELRNKSLELKPIGIIRTSMTAKFDAPHQPSKKESEVSVIELLPDSSFYQAVLDLDSFSHIWLLWWFHMNKTWKPKVRPPRGPQKRRGVLATRSPHRPNPIGITAVKLIKVTKTKIYIGSNDLVDGTPIFDIKPYLPGVDAINEANSGWIGEIEAELENSPRYEIVCNELASEQIKWFESEGVNFIDRAKEILEIDPSPNRTRRIKKSANGKFRMDCGSWRMLFSVKDFTITVEELYSGYSLTKLQQGKPPFIVNYPVHLKFYEVWKK